MLYVALLLATLRRALRARRDLLIENLALRQQLAVYTPQAGDPRCATPTDGSWAIIALAIRRTGQGPARYEGVSGAGSSDDQAPRTRDAAREARGGVAHSAWPLSPPRGGV